jgi:hypothetical protein
MASNPGVLIANKRIHPVDQLLPPTRLAVYGLQHVLAFYAGASLIWYPHLSPLQHLQPGGTGCFSNKALLGNAL